MTDQDAADFVKILKETRTTVHVRGDDKRPVVEFRDKPNRRVVGGTEMKRRVTEK